MRPRHHLIAPLALGGLVSSALGGITVTPSLSDRVNEAFGLEASEVIALDDLEPGAPVLTVLTIAGHPVVLDMEPQSVRAEGYQVLKQVADGSLIPVEPGPVRTLRGTLVGVDDAVAAGSVLDAGLFASIRLATGDTIWIEPIGDRVDDIGPGLHVMYRAEDIVETDARCAAVLMHDEVIAPGAIAPFHGGPADGGNLCTTELACDADFEYFSDYGSVAAVEARINAVINTVNTQYERDVDITHVITAIIVRTSEPDPYSSTDAVTLLNQFRNQWLNNHGNIQRDVAQLFTGKNVDGGTIGIAWLNAICTTFGFGVVESDFNNNFACATDLSAHELGHNWGADHCSCTSNTMNPFITCANVFHPTFSIPEIISFRDSRTCLDCGGVPTGACCFANGSCSIATESDCGNQGGTYQGDGTSCNPCPQPPTGACCIGEACSIRTEADCNANGGAYQGDGSNCAGTDCGPDVATLSCVNTTIGSGAGGLSDLVADDGSDYEIVAEPSGRKNKSEVIICADSPHTSVSSMSITLDTAASASGAKTRLYLRRSNGRWTRIVQYNESTSDTTRTINVSDPNRFVNGVSGLIEIRIGTERRRGGFTEHIDLVEVRVTP